MVSASSKLDHEGRWDRVLRWVGRFLLLAAAGFGLPKATGGLADQPRLTNAASVLRLTQTEASKGLPATIQGVVTLSEPRNRLLYVQDQTAGLRVLHSEDNLKLTNGTLVVLKGVTGMGAVAPLLALREIASRDHGTLPKPRPVALGQLVTGSQDGQWVEVEGTVVGVHETWGRLVLDLYRDSVLVPAQVVSGRLSLNDFQVGSEVRLRGVAASSLARQERPDAPAFYVPAMSEIDLVQPSPADPFSVDSATLLDLRNRRYRPSDSALVRVKGIVSVAIPGRYLFLNDPMASLRVEGVGTASTKSGTVLEVVGVPSWADGGATLLAVFSRVVGRERIPEAIPWKAGVLPGPDLDGRFIRIQGEVIESAGAFGLDKSLLLRHGMAVVEVRMAAPAADQRKTFRPRTGILATGVCELPRNSTGPTSLFTLWVLSPSDLIAVEDVLPASPSWLIASAMLALSAMLLWLARRWGARGLASPGGPPMETGRVQSSEHLTHGAMSNWATAFRELSLLLVIAGAVFMLGSRFGVADMLWEWARRHEAWQIDELFVLAFTLAGLLAVFAWRRWREMRREMALREQATEALRASELRLRKSIEERERIGQDLHDGIIQSIYAVGLNLDGCRRRLPEVPAPLDEVLQRARTDLNGVIRDLRSFITGLESEVLKGRELGAALKSLALTLTQPDGLQFALQIEPFAASHLDSRQTIQLLHIAREAMTNSLRHSKASRARVRLAQNGRTVRLEVEDDGAGFDPAKVLAESRGLRNLSARARDLGADMKVISTPGQGTRIVVEVPVETHRDYEPKGTDTAAAG